MEIKFINLSNLSTFLDNLYKSIKSWVTEQLGSYLPLSGGTMSGNIDMGNNSINTVKQISLPMRVLNYNSETKTVEESYDNTQMLTLQQLSLKTDGEDYLTNVLCMSYGDFFMEDDTQVPYILVDTPPDDRNDSLRLYAVNKGWVEDYVEDYVNENNILPNGNSLDNPLIGDLVIKSTQDRNYQSNALKIYTQYNTIDGFIISSLNDTSEPSEYYPSIQISPQTIKFYPLLGTAEQRYSGTGAKISITSNPTYYDSKAEDPYGRCYIMNFESIHLKGGGYGYSDMPITIGTPVEDNEATTKKYVDDAISAIPIDNYIPLAGTADNAPVTGNIAFDTSTANHKISGIGSIDMVAGTGDSAKTSTVEVVADEHGNNTVKITTNPVDTSETADNAVVPNEYVNITGENITGVAEYSGKTTYYSLNSSGLTLKEADDDNTYDFGTDGNKGQLRFSYGDSSTADLNPVVIKGVGTPVDDTDGANKSYVDTQVSSVNNSINKLVSVTLTSAGWTGSAAPYSQTVSVEEITANDNPILVSMLAVGADADTQKAYNKAFGIISAGAGETADGSVTFYVYDKPAMDITVGLKGV